jgi:hypothetical protein
MRRAYSMLGCASASHTLCKRLDREASPLTRRLEAKTASRAAANAGNREASLGRINPRNMTA